MKNIHLIPTDKPSRLYKTGNFLLLDSKAMPNNTLETMNQHIYITSDLEVKEGDLKVGEYYLYFNKIRQFKEIDNLNRAWKDYKKIILTTDQDLIKDGVQAIDDEFLKWFVKNPSCEWVEVIYDKDAFPYGVETAKGYGWYKIIILQEELTYTEAVKKEERIFNSIMMKQETLEEAAERYVEQITTIEFGKPHNAPHRVKTFIDGAKWQQERMYSEEECYKTLHNLMTDIKLQGLVINDDIDLKRWFEQFKKKNNMAETFMDRLIRERDELQDKLTKLEAFLANKTKAIEISGMEQYNLLIKQVDVMYDYLAILNERINKLQATID